jgi:drug/metabolite transporter (DMT)-like permease
MRTSPNAAPAAGAEAPTLAGRTRGVLPATVGTGIALMLAAQLLIMPASDAVVKYLTASLPVAQLAWARFFFNFLLLAPAALWYHRGRVLTPARPRLQLLRGVLVVTANFLFIAGVRFVPLADALAIAFVAPLAVAAFSPLVLRERVGPAGWAAVAVGFLGALVIIRPGFAATSGAALLPLGAGLAFAAYLLVTRKLAGSGPPLLTQTATAAVGAVLTTLVLPLVWTPPSPAEWALMLVVGTASCVGHLLITTAHEHARAATLAPLTYLGIVSASALGYLVFGDWPDALTWLGAAIVIASGLTIWWHSARA